VLHKPAPLIQLLSITLSLIEVRIFLGEEVLEMLAEREGSNSPFP
jgi:hypothetical protein